MRGAPRAVFLATWVAAAVYALLHLDLGWFPADAGTLGHTAERVLGGELPHRDFQDPYTGGLAALYALSFRVLGVSLMSMRWTTWVVYLAWVPAFWALAARIGGRTWLAALATLLAASWTLPLYAEGMPSWYNLFLATFGALALLRYHDTRRTRWLFLAGVAGGLSILAKIVGLYYVAAAGLFVIYDEAVRSRTPDSEAEPGAGPSSDVAYRALALGACVALGAAVCWLVVRGMGVRHFFLYGVPPLAAIVPVAEAARRPGAHPTAHRLRATAGALSVLILGVALPTALFALPYLLSGSLGALVEGVLLRPSGRLDAVRLIVPAGPWLFAAPAVALLLWYLLPRTEGPAARKAVLIAGALALAAAVAASGADPVYVRSFRALLWLSPLLCLVTAWRVSRAGEGRAPLGVLALALYGLTSLVQVPFPAPAYFFYAAPLGILVAVACVDTDFGRARMGVTLAALLALTVLRFNEGFTVDLGFRYRPGVLTERLELSRAAGLRVSPRDKAEYEAVVGLVEDAGAGDTIFAGPDAPEVYFLSGRANPLPTIYEILDEEGHDVRVLDAIAAAGVRAVVVRRDPLFSPPLSGDLLRELERRFPAGAQIGRFIVAWKPPGTSGRSSADHPAPRPMRAGS